MGTLPAIAQEGPPAPPAGYERIVMRWIAPGQNTAIEELWSDIGREGLRGYQAAQVVVPSGDFLATMAGGSAVCEHGETRCPWRIYVNRGGKAVEVARFTGSADAWCAALSKDKAQLDLCGQRFSLAGLAHRAARVQP
jgi:hypothetical protein